MLNTVAAICELATIPKDRRLFAPQQQPRQPSTAKPAELNKAEFEAAQALAVAAREVAFLADPLCAQTYAVCTTCEATRTYAPKGMLPRPRLSAGVA